MAAKSEKKCRHAITLDSKIIMIKLSDEGISQAEIGRRLGFPRTTVNTIIKNKQKILAEVKSATPFSTTLIRKREGLVAEMERQLMVWVEDQTSRNVPLSQAIIQRKAHSLFDEMKIKKGEVAKDAEFGASRGWFDRFKKRANLHNIIVQGELATADKEALESIPHDHIKAATVGQYLLKKETQSRSILEELLHDTKFADVTLTAEGQHIKTHKSILCLSSKYFMEVLSSGSPLNSVFFRDIKYKELKSLITFIYTGEVTVNTADLESFMKTAELLGITCLCEGNENDSANISSSNTSESMNASFTSSSKIKRKCPEIITMPPSKLRKIHTEAASPKSFKRNCCPPSPEPSQNLEEESETNLDIEEGATLKVVKMEIINDFIDVDRFIKVEKEDEWPETICDAVSPVLTESMNTSQISDSLRPFGQRRKKSDINKQ